MSSAEYEARIASLEAELERDRERRTFLEAELERDRERRTSLEAELERDREMRTSLEAELERDRQKLRKLEHQLLVAERSRTGKKRQVIITFSLGAIGTFTATVATVLCFLQMSRRCIAMVPSAFPWELSCVAASRHFSLQCLRTRALCVWL
jgi:hypothetical protein